MVVTHGKINILFDKIKKKYIQIKCHHRREYIAALSKKKVKCESSHESYSEIDNKEQVSFKRREVDVEQ